MSAPASPDEPGGLRLALNWFHTWFGLFLGGLMFVIFWTGTLAVFDREIDRWMMPDTRLSEAPSLKVDTLVPLVGKHAPGAVQWRMMLPDERTPVLELQASMPDGSYISRMVDPVTLKALPDQGTYGGTEFFNPYHFRLNSGAVGLFICAFAAVVMLALCISGVIIHRKIFADFFTLRIVRKPQRTTLDLHNLTGVLTLPFLLMISFTGVAIFTYTYLPTAQSLMFARDPAALAGGYFSREAAGQPGGELVPLDNLLDKAAVHWGVERPKYVQVIHAGDANSYVEIRAPGNRTISKSTAAIWYDANNGDFLAVSPATGTRAFYDFIYGIHLIQFDHWALRWLYFLSGVAGCVLIATGMLFWVQSRRKRHAKLGKSGVKWAEATTIAFTTGLLLATLGFMISNRLLPLASAGRADMEVQIFHLVWIAALIHAVIRGGKAWAEQTWLIAGGCLLAVILNAVTTPQSLFTAVNEGLWHTAGTDLVLLISSVIAFAAAIKLRSSPATTSTLKKAEA